MIRSASFPHMKEREQSSFFKKLQKSFKDCFEQDDTKERVSVKDLIRVVTSGRK